MENATPWALFGGIGLGALVLLSLAWDSVRWGIVPMPTWGRVRRACVDLMQRRHIRGEIVDLGSGFGGMTLAIAGALPDASVRGIEGSAIAYALGRVAGAVSAIGNGTVRRRPRGTVRWQRADFMGCDLSGADAVFCYLYPGAMQQLAAKLRHELRPGAWVVSHTFALPGWDPVEILRVNDMYRTPIYLYRATAASPPSP